MQMEKHVRHVPSMHRCEFCTHACKSCMPAAQWSYFVLACESHAFGVHGALVIGSHLNATTCHIDLSSPAITMMGDPKLGGHCLATCRALMWWYCHNFRVLLFVPKQIDSYPIQTIFLSHLPVQSMKQNTQFFSSRSDRVTGAFNHDRGDANIKRWVSGRISNYPCAGLWLVL